MKNQFDTINNINLVENNLIHLNFELGRDNPSYFRIAREAHQVFYRSMVEALKGSASIAITGRPKDKKRLAKYKIGNSPFMEIHKVNIKECKKAWKYSSPTPCEIPEEKNKRSEIPPFDDYLKNFYDVLAMIQTKCFMTRYIMSKPINVSDDEMKSLEWLHESVRNEYEHFIPKFYSAPILDLLEVSLICIDKTEKLIFESGNIFQSDIPDTIKILIEKIKLKIQHALKDLKEKT